MRLHQGWIAMICSAVFPGLGQLVNKDYKKFIGFLFAYGFLYIYNILILRPLLLPLVAERASFSVFFSPEFLIYLMITFAVWVVSVEDAWRVGRRKAKE